VSTVRASQPGPGMGRTVRPSQPRPTDISAVHAGPRVSSVSTVSPVGTVGPVCPVRTHQPRPVSVSLLQVVRLASDRVDDHAGSVGMGSMGMSVGVGAGVGLVTPGQEVGSGSSELGRVRFAVFVVDRGSGGGTRTGVRCGVMGVGVGTRQTGGAVGVGVRAHQPGPGRSVSVGV
jgi:hypothetical protein